MRLLSRIALCFLVVFSLAAYGQKPPKQDPGLKKYGNVSFADPIHHKYPIDNPTHIKSAWRSIHVKSHAAKYKPDELAQVKQRIRDAGTAQGITLNERKPKASKTKAIKSSSN